MFPNIFVSIRFSLNIIGEMKCHDPAPTSDDHASSRLTFPQDPHIQGGSVKNKTANPDPKVVYATPGFNRFQNKILHPKIKN